MMHMLNASSVTMSVVRSFKLATVSWTLLTSLHSALAFTAAGSQVSSSLHEQRKSKMLVTSFNEEWPPLELWLDLRGTAITPQMALSKLEEDSVLPASKVVVSIQDAARATQLYELGDPNILMVDENNCCLCSAKDPTISYGTVVSIDGVSFVDPIPALESISNGGWAFVDSQLGGSDKVAERHDAISNLVDFIVGGLTLDLFSLGNKESSGDCDLPLENKTNRGGIAIACQTKADLAQAANCFQSIGSGSVTATESGILIKSEESSSADNNALQSALVLPFDISLWKQAAIIVMPEGS
jgi:hypothetical protein